MDSEQDGTQRTPSTAAYNPSLTDQENFNIITRLAAAEEDLYKKRNLEREKENAHLNSTKEQLKAQQQKLLKIEEGTEEYEKQIKVIQNLNILLEERTAKLDDEAESMQAGADAARDLAGAFGIINAKGTLLGKVFKSLSTSAGRAEFGKNLSENFSAGNVAASTAVKTAELFGYTFVSAFGNIEEGLDLLDPVCRVLGMGVGPACLNEFQGEGCPAADHLDLVAQLTAPDRLNGLFHVGITGGQ